MPALTSEPDTMIFRIYHLTKNGKMKDIRTYIMRTSLPLACTLMLAGCSETTSIGPSIRIRVRTSGTRSAEITTSSLEEGGKFVMDAKLDDEAYDFTKTPKEPVNQYYIQSGGSANVLLKSGAWALSTDYNWVAEDLTRFWCYAPETVNGNRAYGDMEFGTEAKTAKMSFDYAMPSAGQTDSDGNHIDADKCDDIIFAYADKKFSSNTSDYIDLTFNHAMSKIRFCVGIDDGTFDTTLKIKDITINNVPTSGSCIFDGEGTIDAGTMFTWSGVGSSTKKTFSQTVNASFTTKPAGWTAVADTLTDHSITHRYVCENAFFLLPHAMSGVTVDITFIAGDEEILVEGVTLPDYTWMPGKYYNYKIGATTLGRTVKVSVKLADWNNYDDKVFI